jgi:predicted GNAT superfamily acetyltransferase
MSAPLVFRKCSGVAEFEDCVRLQKEVWNFADVDLVPLRMFVVAEKVGGQVLGCFDGAHMAGFALAIPGSRCGHAYLHSHMLAVRPEYRDRGIGRRLKLAQRDDALARKFELMEWTFDPLEIKNAYFNIERLGAIARRYTINQYGISSSPLHGGLPTDRLVAEWWLHSRRVEQVLSEQSPLKKIERKIEVPAQIGEWKASAGDRRRAVDLQTKNREQFLESFAAGLAVLGYQRDEKGNGIFLLGRWNENWSYASEPQ